MRPYSSCLAFFASLVVCISCAASPYAPERIGKEPYGSDLAEYAYDAAGGRLYDSIQEQAITYGLNGKPEVIETDGALTQLGLAIAAVLITLGVI